MHTPVILKHCYWVRVLPLLRVVCTTGCHVGETKQRGDSFTSLCGSVYCLLLSTACDYCYVRVRLLLCACSVFQQCTGDGGVLDAGGVTSAGELAAYMIV